MKYVFVGNRKYVLEEMIKNELNIEKIFVIKDSHLERDIQQMNFDYLLVNSKSELISLLEKTNFDILISNGCPYILPISKLKKSKYVNIHPSFLPDLKGVDPVIGSILFERDSGATCHYMNDEIDSGDNISRVKIDFSNDLDAGLLYHLSFLAEKQCFNEALRRNFETIKKQEENKDNIYYSRKESDKHITFNESNKKIISKVKAFNNKSQGAYFLLNDLKIKVFNAEILVNNFIYKNTENIVDMDIIFSYENTIIFKKDNEIMKFSQISVSADKIKKIEKYG